MRETVLITGANSFIAKHLIGILEKDYTIKLLTRSPQHENEYAWDTAAKTIDAKALDNVDYIIHLAGAKLNDGTPLTAERKHLIRESRIGAADFLHEELNRRKQHIKGFVSASAIGYYGFTDATNTIDEDGDQGVGFNADLCVDWEAAADRFKSSGTATHVSKIRVSIVLGAEGGILPIYVSHVDANPAVAEQGNASYLPWNHVEDMAGIFAFAVRNNLDGVYNSVAPQPASVEQVFKAIANHKYGKTYAIDKFTGQHLVSDRIIKAGFEFKYPDIDSAMAQLFNKNN